MNIYLLNRTDKYGYDEYDSLVVIAESEEDAKTIDFDGSNILEYDCPSNCWVDNVNLINVELIGKADINQKRGVVLASFNAG